MLTINVQSHYVKAAAVSLLMGIGVGTGNSDLQIGIATFFIALSVMTALVWMVKTIHAADL